MKARHYGSCILGAAILALLRPDQHLEINTTNAIASGSLPSFAAVRPISEEPLHMVRIRPHTRRIDLESQPPKLESSKFPAPTHEDLCTLKNARTSVPLSGGIRVVLKRVRPTPNAPTFSEAWILSPDCPEGFYSMIRYTDEGQLIEQVDCRQTTLTELAARTGEKGSINKIYPEVDGLNIALSGQGYFVLQCPGAELRLTRDGQLNRDAFGQWRSEDGCVLMNTKGQVMTSSDLGATGCSENESECVATLDPSHDQIGGLDYVNNYSFRAISSLPLDQSITRVGSRTQRAHLFVNALEDVRNPNRGPTGVQWNARAMINLEDLDCR